MTRVDDDDAGAGSRRDRVDDGRGGGAAPVTRVDDDDAGAAGVEERRP